MSTKQFSRSTKVGSADQSTFTPVPAETEAVAHEVIGAAIEVHRHLGPGFLERIYHDALCVELQTRGVPFERERPITVRYKAVEIPGQRVDLIIDNKVIVELKAVPQLDDLHEARVISYLRTTGLRLGLLMNFNHKTLKEGLNRLVV
jgi:GxxExxY protein